MNKLNRLDGEICTANQLLKHKNEKKNDAKNISDDCKEAFEAWNLKFPHQTKNRLFVTENKLLYLLENISIHYSMWTEEVVITSGKWRRNRRFSIQFS